MRHVAMPLVCALAMALAGCGSVPGAASLATAPAPAAPATAAAAATVALLPAPSITATTAAPSREAGIRVIGQVDIPDAELQADAASAGYTLQDAVSVPHVTGFVRRSSGHDYLLEADHNEFGQKMSVTYTLDCPDFATYTWLGEHVNKRVNIKGLFAADHTVTVTFADGATDLSFLTNWWTKGKLKGQVFSTAGLPLVNCEVKARSAEGYVFLGNSDDTGKFQLANLAPGWYQIWFTKNGYGVQSTVITIAKHKATTVEGVLSGN